MKKDLILIGGGGHCRACIDVIESTIEYNIIGITDQPENINKKVLNYPIIACDDQLPELLQQYKNFFITIGHIKSPKLRIRLFENLKQLGANFPVIISKRAYVSKYSNIGEGTIVMHDTLINPNVQIGLNCIINTKSLIEHDSLIGNHCHISTNSVINGTCNVGDKVLIGSNSVVLQNLNIVENTIVGAGSVVVKNINTAGVWVGNPARQIQK